jgi:DNA polymerase-1
MHALAARGLELAGVTSDTALAALPGPARDVSFDLADLTLRYLGKGAGRSGGEETTGQLALDLVSEDKPMRRPR